MIDWIVDLVVGHWPVLATGFAGLAVGITVLRWVAPEKNGKYGQNQGY